MRLPYCCSIFLACFHADRRRHVQCPPPRPPPPRSPVTTPAHGPPLSKRNNAFISHPLVELPCRLFDPLTCARSHTWSPSSLPDASVRLPCHQSDKNTRLASTVAFTASFVSSTV